MIHVETVRHGKVSIILAGKQPELLEKLTSSKEEGVEHPGGRGTIRIIELSTCSVVKRHFRHGGLLRSLMGDLFAGSSRAFSEFYLTLKARQLGARWPKFWLR